jgi:hypothetical protein
MNKITIYEATDGRRFERASEALAHESLLGTLDEIDLPLGNKPDNVNFSNGGGYIQHSRSTVTDFKGRLLSLACNLHPSIREAVAETPFENVHPGSIVGRILDDSNSPLYRLWYRLYCIDRMDREWGQPYFALNPKAGKQELWKP